MSLGRILGIDLGEKRVGLAISDPSQMIASPLGKLEFRTEHQLIIDIEAVVREKEVKEIVVGYPLRTSGKKGELALFAERIAEQLKERTGLEVHLWDERMSTQGAERALLEADLSRKKRKEVRDQVSAGLILQSFLESRRSGV